MHILLLCNKPPYPAKDGGSIATSALIKGFSDLGHKVFVLTFNTNKHYVEHSEIKKFLPANTTIKLVHVDTDVVPFKAFRNLLFSKIPYNAERFISEEFSGELENVLKNNEFDVVQLEGLYLSFCVPIIRAHSKALISYRAHNIEFEIWRRSAFQEKNIFKQLYLKILANRLKKFEINFINQYDLLIPITQRDAEMLNYWGNRKPIFVAPAGVEPEAVAYTPEKINYPSIFFIGALDWMPNQEGLMWFVDYVWPVIMRKRSNIKMHVAGRNAPDWLVDRLTGINVNYWGEVGNAYQFMNQFAIMVVPLFSGSGMRVKIVEGMLLGKAVVTTTIGTEGIETTNEQNIMVADNAEDFADCVLKLASNTELFSKVSLSARDFILKNYNNNQITINLVQFFTKNK